MERNITIEAYDNMSPLTRVYSVCSKLGDAEVDILRATRTVETMVLKSD